MYLLRVCVRVTHRSYITMGELRDTVQMNPPSALLLEHKTNMSSGTHC